VQSDELYRPSIAYPRVRGPRVVAGRRAVVVRGSPQGGLLSSH